MSYTSQINLRVRVNNIDHTMATTGPLDNTSLPRVPILRIFGDTSIGQKACIHIHQIYPYFFVEYKGEMDPKLVNRYISQLTYNMNYALALSMKRNPKSPKSRFIRAIILVKGVHFYGFHSSYSPFLKIHLIDPAFTTRAVTLLRSGTVMHTAFRVYESHLSYPLQFMCDFGLYGCGWLDLGEVWERAGEGDMSLDGQISQDEEGAASNFPPSPYFRTTRMPLELDVAAHQILNRHKISAREMHHKLTIPQPLQPLEPLVPSVRELWDEERARRTARGLSPTPEMPIDVSATIRGVGGEWISEARFWDEIRARIEQERSAEPVLSRSESWERWIMSTFESVEALWDEEWKRWRPKDTKVGPRSPEKNESQISEESNPFAAAIGSSQSQSINEGKDCNYPDIDENMVTSQQLTSQILNHEQQRQREGTHDREHGKENPETGSAATPQGTPRQPLDVQLPLNEDNLRTPTKAQSSFENAFSDAWDKIKRPHLYSCEVDDSLHQYSTPRRPRISYGSYLTPLKSPSNIDAPTAFLDSVDNIQEQQASLKTQLNEVMVKRTMKPRRSVRFVEFDPDSPFVSKVDSDDNTLHKHHIGLESHAILEENQAMEHVPRPCKRRKLSGAVPSAIRGDEMELPASPPSSIPWISQVQETGQDVDLNSPQTVQATAATSTYVYALAPPSCAEVVGSLEDYNQPMKVYRDPWYSNPADAPERPREFAGLIYYLKGGSGLDVLSDWLDDACTETPPTKQPPLPLLREGTTGWEFASHPPSGREVKQWMRNDSINNGLKRRPRAMSQIRGPTQFPDSTAQTSKGSRESANLSVLALEVFVPSLGKQLPNKDKDSIQAIFYAFHDQNHNGEGLVQYRHGAIVVRGGSLNTDRLRGHITEEVATELDLLNRTIDIVNDSDPDIVAGWELQKASWGYLNARGQTHGLDIQELIGRAPSKGINTDTSEQWDHRTTSTFSVTGRHALNVWRVFRSELHLRTYTFENVAYHLLKRRIPLYTVGTLNEWFQSNVVIHNAKLLDYFTTRTKLILEMLDKSEFITKTAEFARVFGVDFFSVINRGSQFKVESFMFRIAKPESFVLLSPSKDDVGKQNAAEAIPLVMEPLSAFYNSPVVVLDFQSLYPSVMIAYNLCYSTALGRVQSFQGKNKFGVSELDLPLGLLEKLQKHIHIAPNGIIYVKEQVRKSLLARMLTELLNTRVMIKQAMKSLKDDKALRRTLDARQLGLKLMANVVYGYTGASFSGRMPAVEVADSIVQIGRETLEKAIRVIETTKKWGAKVVYGDTDSLFIYLRGKTKDQAFRIGHDIAGTITEMNPAPIRLKFEKVYLPCVLLAKKRYVGFKYEAPDDIEPTFDAKGIETVRRDGCAAQSKMTEMCLKILFRTQDLTAVKEYCYQSWSKILDNRVTIDDFIFAKEVKMGTYSDKGPPPPGVVVAARRTERDPSDEAQYGERIPYVIIRGEPNSRLVDRAVAPEELVTDGHKHLDALYYITQQLIPPLDRIFCLLGADVKAWYDEMPKTIRANQPPDAALRSPRRHHILQQPQIEEHFLSSQCVLCDSPTNEALCGACHSKPHDTFITALSRIREYEYRLKRAHLVCASCSSTAMAEPIRCESIDCPWFFERRKAEVNVEAFGGVLRELTMAMGSTEDPRFDIKW